MIIKKASKIYFSRLNLASITPSKQFIQFLTRIEVSILLNVSERVATISLVRS